MYELAQHTADLEMRVTADSVEELFAEALRGLMEVIQPEGGGEEKREIDISLEAPDRTVLLVDFLNEALTRLHVDRGVCVGVSFEVLSETALEGRFQVTDATGFAEDVKAVTYHGAEVRRDAGVWSTALVLDI
jgi:SHS2 domain-containing protein